MSKFKAFGSLLQEQDKLGKSHNVLLTPNADLRATVHRISLNNADIADENIEELITSYEAMQDEFIHNTIFNPIQAIANAFADKLNEGAAVLRDIKQDVSKLSDRYQEAVAMRVAEDPTLAKIHNNDTTLTMESVRWDYLDRVDELTIRAELHGSINKDIDAETTPSTIDLLINQLDGANAYNKPTLNVIELSKEVIDRVVIQLHNDLPSETTDDLREMFVNLLKHDERGCTRAVKMVEDFAKGKTCNTINKVLHVASSYKYMFASIQSGAADLATSTMTELNAHIASMNKIMNLLLYIAGHYRSHTWENAIMVPGPLCNEDNRESYEKEGGSITQLVQHNNRFYNSLPLPQRGVSGASILKSAKHLENEFATEAAHNINILNKTKDQIDRGCFIMEAINYLKDNKPYSTQFAHSNNLEKYAASIFDSMKNSAVEAKFYKLILNAKHVGTIVPDLYNRINKAYVDYSVQTGHISETACEELDVNVYSSMISEYLVDQGILVVNTK